MYKEIENVVCDIIEDVNRHINKVDPLMSSDKYKEVYYPLMFIRNYLSNTMSECERLLLKISDESSDQ